MIQNDKELECTQQRSTYFYRLLAQFRVTVKPEIHPMMTGGYIAKIEKMHAEVMAYLSRHASDADSPRRTTPRLSASHGCVYHRHRGGERMKSFNTYGPCRPEDHYMLPAAERLPGVRRVIDQKIYFVLHAPRQVGKTTAVMELARELTAEGRYTALLVTMETGAAFNDDPGAAELAILGTWRSDAEDYLPPELRPPAWPTAAAGERIHSALRAWVLPLRARWSCSWMRLIRSRMMR